jgi:hypothetical protein
MMPVRQRPWFDHRIGGEMTHVITQDDPLLSRARRLLLLARAI